MKKLSVFLASLLFLGLSVVQAQTVRITGTVTSSEDGMPLPGVSVFVKGTTVGVTTNIDGKYEINVPQNTQALSFSFVGYETQDAAIAGRAVIDVVLNPETVQMQEVVVTALGIKRSEKSIGYSATSVSGENLSELRTADVMTGLAGKVAGVQISSTSSDPG
ncbi:MAG TPA: carboxypeptidase-like regulatory domain-containing protein, partial [Tenuifilaceae bacterium]|nr:carboxypeptidase-like regulatory domain-containing protein [Tenuifilaceae bacterium]